MWASLRMNDPGTYCVGSCNGRVALCNDFLLHLTQGLSRLCVQGVIWTHRTLFFDSLDTQKFMSEFSDDDFS